MQEQADQSQSYIFFSCCMTKFSCNFWILAIGRIFGGISTCKFFMFSPDAIFFMYWYILAMLFSTFESWYVYEHIEHYGFPSEWIGVTFSKTTFFNGLLAIFAGVLSNFCAETMGYGKLFKSKYSMKYYHPVSFYSQDLLLHLPLQLYRSFSAV